MPPDPISPEITQPDSGPVLDHLLAQQDAHHREMAGQLDAMIQQNDQNAPGPLLDVLIQQGEKTQKLIGETGGKVAEAVGALAPVLQESAAASQAMGRFLETMKGDKGDKGDTGDVGSMGATGAKGETGDVGPIGPMGPAGIDGKDGKDGIDGEDAVVDYALIKSSVLAEIPVPKDGKDGADGSPDSGADIVKKLTILPTSERLPYSAIKDAPDFLRQSSRDYAFTELTDTPKSYASAIGKTLRVNAAGNGVDFATTDQVVDILTLARSGVTTNYYVATTGSDTLNAGTSAASPFKTIQKAIDTIAGGLFPGPVVINVADGTYSGNIVAKDIMGKASYVTTSSVQPPNAPSVVTIQGNSASPGNVILIGTDTMAGTFTMDHVSTNYIVDGFDVRGLGGALSRGFYCAGPKSTLIVNNFNSSALGNTIFANFGARVFYKSGAAGGVHAASINFCTAGYMSLFRLDRGVTCTGMATGIAIINRGGIINFNTNGQTYNFTLTGASSGGIVMLNPFSAFIGVGSDTFNVTGCKVGVIGVSTGGYVNLQGGGTWNLTDCTGGVADISVGGIFQENGASTWNYLGTSVATYKIYDGAMSGSLNNFTSAVPVFTVLDTDFKSGYDWRYQDIATWNIAGAVTVGNTGYVTHNAQQATAMPVYIAQQDAVVDKLEVRSRVSNGAAQTDTYTLVRNGVDTTMVVTVTNAATASTTVNPVTLAAGDYLALKLVSAAGTTAADVLIQAVIRKT